MKEWELTIYTTNNSMSLKYKTFEDAHNTMEKISDAMISKKKEKDLIVTDNGVIRTKAIEAMGIKEVKE